MRELPVDFRDDWRVWGVAGVQGLLGAQCSNQQIDDNRES